MQETISFRTLSDRSANWARRLCCAAKLALARTSQPEKLCRQRAIEILETAPENGFTSRHFDPLYRQLVPLYLAANHFDEALLCPDFDHRHLGTFKTAFERFNLMFKVPPSRTVFFYLGVINLAYGDRVKAEEQLNKVVGKSNPWNVPLSDILRRLRDDQVDAAKNMLGPSFGCLEQVVGKKPTARHEIEEFNIFCKEHPYPKAIGRKRDELILRWLMGEIPAPEISFTCPVAKKGNSGISSIFRFNNRGVYVASTEIEGNEVAISAADKLGRKILNVQDLSGPGFIAKCALIKNPDGFYEIDLLTPGPYQFPRWRTAVIEDWLEGRGDPPPFFFEYTQDSRGKFILFEIGKGRTPVKEPAESVPEGEARQVDVKYSNRDGDKLASLFVPENLNRPFSEYRLQKGPDGCYHAEPLSPNSLQKAHQRGELINAWLEDKIADPDEVFTYHLREYGVFPLTSVGGKQVHLHGLSGFFRGIPLTRAETIGLEDWFFSSSQDPGTLYFKPEVDLSQVIAARDKRLLALWRKANRIRVRLKTIKGEKHAIVFQEGSPLPHRYYRLLMQADGTCRAEPRNPTRLLAHLKDSEKIISYLFEGGPIPEGLFPYRVLWHGAINITGARGNLIALQGLKEILRICSLSKKQAGDLPERYPHLIFSEGKNYRFNWQPTVHAEIMSTGDRELIRLWDKTHRAWISFREEEGKDRKRIIVGVHHFESQELAAEFDLVPAAGGGYQVFPLSLTEHQSAMRRGREFFNWVLRNGPAPAKSHIFPHLRGRIVLFAHYFKLLCFTIGIVNLPRIKFRVSAIEENGRKYVKVRYTYEGLNFERKFEIFGNEADNMRVVETPESLAVIEALPDELRRLFIREKRSPRPAPHH